MFRRNRPEDTQTSKSEDPSLDLSAPPLKPFSRRGTHVTDQSAEAVIVDEPPARPGTDLAQRRPARPRPPGSSEGNKLTVGREIHLKGEITACDKLIVEGHVEASKMVARAIEVAPSGYFKGDAQVDEADISGRFEGTLIARDKLTVRSKGKVSGEIRYGTIIIESGGEISGAMQTLTDDEPSSGSGSTEATASSSTGK